MAEQFILSTNIPREAITVSFIDTDGLLVDGITVDQAKDISCKNPDTKFYFEGGDGEKKELTIDEVQELQPEDLLSPIDQLKGDTLGPQLSGPPVVQVFGGGGIGAKVNPIISPVSSSVIGFDIVNPGFGYLKTPSAAVIDLSGRGSGASLKVNMEDDDVDTTNAQQFIINTDSVEGNTNIGNVSGIGTSSFSGSTTQPNDLQKTANNYANKIIFGNKRSKKIKNITILSPGNKYLSAPDGSLSANERVWKEPDEGYVKTKDGGYFIVQPYRPIQLKEGDTYFPPNGSSRYIEKDEMIEIPLLPVIPPKPESLGVPYPVVLIIDEIEVLDQGFGYKPGDKFIITPNNGADTELVVSETGQIQKVNVLQSGVGFIDFPRIQTRSVNGFNATFSIIFKPIRIDLNLPIEEQIRKVLLVKDRLGKTSKIKIPKNLQLVTVIDCVGRVF